MVLPDDPKEAHFSSLLPWILLYHLIKQEEAAFDCMLRQQIADEDDEGKKKDLSSIVYSGDVIFFFL